jgi:ADP-ribose pyrophosphatase YjhB (NUDIX family)
VAAERRYPSRPVVGVAAVVFTTDRHVVLVRRGQPPLVGEWSLPGGVLELGESLAVGLAREVLEETGLVVEVGAMADVFEHVSVDLQGAIQYHFVILDYVCWVRSGALVAGSDASDVAMADPRDLRAYALTAKAASVIARAYQLAFAGEPADT